jgi:hypothetical protein
MHDRPGFPRNDHGGALGDNPARLLAASGFRRALHDAQVPNRSGWASLSRLRTSNAEIVGSGSSQAWI